MRLFQCRWLEDREEGSVLVPVEDFFPPPASLKARKIGEKPSTNGAKNIYKEGNPRDMEKNEGIMSVFNRYSLRTTFAIARNAKESMVNMAIGHLLSVCLNYCVILHFW